MLKLDAAQGAWVHGAFDRLIGSGELQSRRSSHLSVAGAGPTGGSAHKGWKFLKGYEELLIQKEGTGDVDVPYLFLKCEGAPMSGLANTVEHGIDWAYKSFAGHGKCYSPALHNLAKNHPDVGLRAAENFGKRLAKLHSQLGLKGGTMITIGQVVDELCSIWVVGEVLGKLPVEPVPRRVRARPRRAR